MIETWLLRRWPFCLLLLITLIVVLVVRHKLRKGRSVPQLDDQRLLRRTVLSLVSLMGVSLSLATLDMEHHFLAVVGIIISGGLALASTPLLSNLMAGAMLLFEETYRPGDILQFDDQAGRVTQVRLLYTELQTEDRDLMRVPSFHIVSRPVKVVHAEGTIIACTVSLGYDVSRAQIERVLEMAALAAELRDPRVQVVDLGDHSVTYRVAGVLEEVNAMVTAKSNLRKMVVDMLHGAGIEIVSPMYQNQRRLATDQSVIPDDVGAGELGLATAADHVFFPDAERASKLVRLADQLEETKAEIAKLQAKQNTKTSPQMAERIERKQRHVERMEAILKGLGKGES